MYASKISLIWQFLSQPTHSQKSATNIVFFSFVLGTALLSGSLVSGFAVTAIFWPLLWMLHGKFEIYIPKAVWAVAAAFMAFFLVEAILGLALGGPDAFNESIENVPFLAVLPIWVAIVAAPRDLIKTLSLVAAVATVVGILLASLNTFILASQSGFWFLSVYRPELMTGNSNVMALVSAMSLAAILSGFSISGSKMYLGLLLLGATAAIVLICVSGSRAIWPSILIVPFVYFIVVRPKIRLPGKRMLISLAMVNCILSIPAINLVGNRVNLTMVEVKEISKGRMDESFGQRLVLWRIAYKTFQKSPLVGVGPGNAKQAMSEESIELTGKGIGFTHFHNMFATAAVRGGLIELIALLGVFLIPLVVAINGVKVNQFYSKNHLAFLISLQIIYLLSGVTGIAIGHDIHDSLFVTGTVFALYGIYSRSAVRVE